jgi:phosphoribosyl 1,2-cyclic phosphodiesterase
MRVKFWGVRGSVPVADGRMMRYGGNTSCVEVTLGDGTELILDAGTGIRGLSAARSGEIRSAQILLTHLHLDHIQGLLFFAPLFDPRSRVEVYGPLQVGPDLQVRLARYLSEPLSPVEIRELPATVSFTACPDREWEFGPARIRAATVHHRGVTLGYRITEGDTVLSYIPDHDPGLGGNLDEDETEWISGLGLAENASLLIHDCQYSDEEYLAHVGWGHSRMSDALAFARRAGAEQIALFHHDPLHDDAMLDDFELQAKEHWRRIGRDPQTVTLAREQTVFDLPE